MGTSEGNGEDSLQDFNRAREFYRTELKPDQHWMWRFRGKYVAIMDNEVISSSDNPYELRSQVLSAHGHKLIFIVHASSGREIDYGGASTRENDNANHVTPMNPQELSHKRIAVVARSMINLAVAAIRHPNTNAILDKRSGKVTSVRRNGEGE